VNDVGKQVVVLTWGVRNVPKSSVTEEDRDKTDHKLVAYYREANKLLEEADDVKEQIADMLRRFEAGDKTVFDPVRETAEAMIKGLKETLSDINVELDKYTWESDFITDGSAKEVVNRLKESKYSGQTDDGAWYVDLKDFGIQGKNTKFTFTRSDGTTLYTTRDLAYHLDKFKRADRAVDVLGEDQKLGSKQLCSALEIMGSEKIPEALFYSFVSLPEGKMSTRKGVVVYLDDLIDEAVSRAVDEIRSRRNDLSEEEMLSIARKVGIGAIRYNIVRVQAEKQLVFRWNEALNFDGNSGPYIQYVHARACSMLKKAGEYKHCTEPAMFADEYEKALIKALSKLGSVIREAGEEKRVHILPAYGHEVAAAFNQFYAMVPVLSSDENRDARLTLVECTRTVLRNVLDCLGIDYPEEM
jgi:arginyl-tRNA synthetase